MCVFIYNLSLSLSQIPVPAQVLVLTRNRSVLAQSVTPQAAGATGIRTMMMKMVTMAESRATKSCLETTVKTSRAATTNQNTQGTTTNRTPVSTRRQSNTAAQRDITRRKKMMKLTGEKSSTSHVTTYLLCIYSCVMFNTDQS